MLFVRAYRYIPSPKIALGRAALSTTLKASTPQDPVLEEIVKMKEELLNQMNNMEKKMDSRMDSMEKKMDSRMDSMEKKMGSVQYQISELRGALTEESLKKKLESKFGPSFPQTLVIRGLQTLIETLFPPQEPFGTREKRHARLIDSRETFVMDLIKQKEDMLIKYIYDNQLADATFYKLFQQEFGTAAVDLLTAFNISIQAISKNVNSTPKNGKKVHHNHTHFRLNIDEKSEPPRSLFPEAEVRQKFTRIYDEYNQTLTASLTNASIDVLDLKEKTRRKYLNCLHTIIDKSSNTNLIDMFVFGMKSLKVQKELLKSPTGLSIMILTSKFKSLDKYFPLIEIEIDCQGYRSIESDFNHATISIGEIKSSVGAIDIAIEQLEWKLEFLVEMLKTIHNNPHMTITWSGYIYLPLKEKGKKDIDRRLLKNKHIEIEYI